MSGTITGGNKVKEEVEVTNTYEPGKLVIEKTIAGNAKNENDEFTFEITVDDGSSGNAGSYTIKGQDDTVISTKAIRSKEATIFELKGGQKAEFAIKKSGSSFTVREVSADTNGYETTLTSSGGTITGKTVTGVINKTAAVTVSYTNTKETVEIKAGKVWKSGEQTITWPEDVESVEFTVYKKVNNGQLAVVTPNDIADYVTEDEKSAFSNPIVVTKDTENHKAIWSKLPKKYLVSGIWYDAKYTVIETKINYTATSGKLAEGKDIAADEQGVITNELPKVEIEGEKTWVDSESSHNNAEDITLKLERTTKPVSESSEWNEVTGKTPVWTENHYKFSDLDKYNASGTEYEYRVSETQFKVGNATYTVTKSRDTYTVTSNPENAPKFNVTQDGNNFTNKELTEFEFAKVWRIVDTPVEWPDGLNINIRLSREVSGTTQTTEKVAIGKDTTEINVSFGAETYTITRVSDTDNIYSYKLTELSKFLNDDKTTPWTYKIIEDQVDGYNKPKYFIVVSGVEKEQHPDENVFVEAGSTGRVKIVNDKITVALPSTGGIGTTPYTIAGSLLMAFTALAYVFKKKRLTLVPVNDYDHSQRPNGRK